MLTKAIANNVYLHPVVTLQLLYLPAEVGVNSAVAAESL